MALAEMPANDLPAVLDVEGVAALLRCSGKTVEDLARRKRLPGMKFGVGWVFPAAALLQHLHAEAMKSIAPVASPWAQPSAVPTSDLSAEPLKRGRKLRPLPRLIDLGGEPRQHLPKR